MNPIVCEEVKPEPNSEETSGLQVSLASIQERYCLNPSSTKKTYHLVLKTKGPGWDYEVGDCVGIYPQNDSSLVDQIIAAFQTDPDTLVLNRHNNPLSLKKILLEEVNLNRIPKKLGGKDFLNFINDHRPDAQDFCSQLLPMLPRFYSIASARCCCNDEIHLTVALTENSEDFLPPFGTCSHYLCEKAPLNKECIPIYLQRSKDFQLSPESLTKPLIMIGPGTGVAPFRGFMQERFAKHARENWLFFGERSRQHDFYYKDFWLDLESQGFLTLDLAFSRDQEEKVYVQHRMEENSKKFWHWLENGAYLYVCGDAKKMARDVEKSLQKILMEEGNLCLNSAKAYIKNLKQEKRYRKDVY